MYIIKITITLLVVLLYSGCVKQKVENRPINDLQNIKQKPYIYAKEFKALPSKLGDKLILDFEQNYFYPWHTTKFTFTYVDATWGNIYAKKKVYSENLTMISKEWFTMMIDNSNFARFDTLRKKAITNNNSHLKVFPTISKIFYDPKEAGEGFPFDYNENSSIKINTPLFVSHLSKDRLWAFIESSIAIGWIKVSDIAYVDTKFITVFENGNYFINLKDNTNIYKNGYLLSDIDLGTLFPKTKKGFIIASKNYKNNAFIRVIDINGNFEKIGIDFNANNIKRVSQELIGERYGWGGILGNRDCSLMIKDFYAPFGIYLGRNSGKQKDAGHSIDISNLTDEMKKEFIIKNAIPFQTLIYLPGHIMIYVGEKNNEPLVFHNMWGVKTLDSDGNYGRSIIGKAAVTTLKPGSELDNYADKYSILRRVKSITMLTQKKDEHDTNK
jgi:hypothetical protein